MTEEWRDYANCRSSSIDLFFPKNQTYQEASEVAKVCQECRVKEECGEYAIGQEIDYGIWGGMSPERRISIRQRRKEISNVQPSS